MSIISKLNCAAENIFSGTVLVLRTVPVAKHYISISAKYARLMASYGLTNEISRKFPRTFFHALHE